MDEIFCATYRPKVLMHTFRFRVILLLFIRFSDIIIYYYADISICMMCR